MQNFIITREKTFKKLTQAFYLGFINFGRRQIRFTPLFLTKFLFSGHHNDRRCVTQQRHLVAFCGLGDLKNVDEDEGEIYSFKKMSDTGSQKNLTHFIFDLTTPFWAGLTKIGRDEVVFSSRSRKTLLFDKY